MTIEKWNGVNLRESQGGTKPEVSYYTHFADFRLQQLKNDIWK